MGMSSEGKMTSPAIQQHFSRTPHSQTKMALEPLDDDVRDRVLGMMLAGEASYTLVPQPMLNHAQCHGLLTKKSPDGSRVVRYKTDAMAMRDEMDKMDPNDGPEDFIELSHKPGTFADMFCEFNHGVHELSHGADTDRYGNPSRRSEDNFFARLNLAQLRDMEEKCALCSVLVQGIDRWRWVWQPKMMTQRYCDVVWSNRHRLGEGEDMELFHGADAGHFDERFLPGPLRDEEVALYVSFSRTKRTVEVNVQKYPHPPFRRRTGLVTLEVFIDQGEISPSSNKSLPPLSDS